MANTNAPFGLACRGNLNGGAMQTMRVYVPSTYATAIYVGDPVKIVGGADATTGVMTVNLAGVSDLIFGVVASVDPIKGVAIGSENLNRVYRPASVGMYVNIYVDPDYIYEIQADGAVTAAMMGVYGNIGAGTPSATTGMSGVVFAIASTTATRAGAQLQVLDCVAEPNNAALTTYTRLLVKLILQPQQS